MGENVGVQVNIPPLLQTSLTLTTLLDQGCTELQACSCVCLILMAHSSPFIHHSLQTVSHMSVILPCP